MSIKDERDRRKKMKIYGTENRVGYDRIAEILIEEKD